MALMIRLSSAMASSCPSLRHLKRGPHTASSVDKGDTPPAQSLQQGMHAVEFIEHFAAGAAAAN